MGEWPNRAYFCQVACYEDEFQAIHFEPPRE